MRQRIEDLGRLSVLIRNLLDHDLFTDEFRLKPSRPKDALEWFASKTNEQKDDIVHSWAYGLESIQSDLYEMLSIAEGTDDLNERTETD